MPLSEIVNVVPVVMYVAPTPKSANQVPTEGGS